MHSSIQLSVVCRLTSSNICVCVRRIVFFLQPHPEIEIDQIYTTSVHIFCVCPPLLFLTPSIRLNDKFFPFYVRFDVLILICVVSACGCVPLCVFVSLLRLLVCVDVVLVCLWAYWVHLLCLPCIQLAKMSVVFMFHLRRAERRRDDFPFTLQSSSSPKRSGSNGMLFPLIICLYCCISLLFANIFIRFATTDPTQLNKRTKCPTKCRLFL